MQGVVRSVNEEVAAGNGQRRTCLEALGAGGIFCFRLAVAAAPESPVAFCAGIDAAAAGGKEKFPAFYAKFCFRLYAVVCGSDVKAAAGDIDIAAFRVFVVVRLYAVAAGVDGKGTAGDFHAILAVEAVPHGGDGVRAAGDHQIVFGNDGVVVIPGYAQRARAVQGDVRAAEQRRVHVVPFFRGVFRAVRKGILRAVGQGDKHLVRFFDIQRGVVLAVNIHAREHKLHFLRIRTGDDHAPIAKRSREHVNAFLGNGQHRAFRRRARALDGDAIV